MVNVTALSPSQYKEAVRIYDDKIIREAQVYIRLRVPEATGALVSSYVYYASQGMLFSPLTYADVVENSIRNWRKPTAENHAIANCRKHLEEIAPTLWKEALDAAGAKLES